MTYCFQCHQDKSRGVGEAGKVEKQRGFALLFCFVVFVCLPPCFVWFDFLKFFFCGDATRVSWRIWGDWEVNEIRLGYMM